MILFIAVALVLASGVSAQQTLKWVGEVDFGRPWEDVPEAYRNLPIGRLEIPTTRTGWEKKREEIRGILHECLGEMPPRPQPPRVKTLLRQQRAGYTLEKLEIENGAGMAIPAYLVIPDGLEGPAPAILLLHWHSGDKDGVLFSSEGQNVLAPLLERRYVLMAIDANFNGDRLGKGPGGAVENLVGAQRDSLFKLNLWLGRTLWGMMLRDDQIALDYLASRPEVDPERIGATGMSMGSTGAWWLAALDERVKAVVGVACFTRYEELIAHGQLRAHAIYYFVPGILRHFDTEAVVGLIAPRPMLALTGDRDPTSPPSGIRTLERKVKQIYRLYDAGDRFNSIIYEDTGHVYLPEMKKEMAAWFDRWLR